jgi:hypothetical protein
MSYPNYPNYPGYPASTGGYPPSTGGYPQQPQPGYPNQVGIAVFLFLFFIYFYFILFNFFSIRCGRVFYHKFATRRKASEMQHLYVFIVYFR